MSAAPVIFDAMTELRSEIEEVAQDGTLSADQRAARLLEFRSDLLDLLGSIDTYAGDTANESERVPGESEVTRLRENADIRESLIRLGEATEEQCDEMMLYSHETLDELAEEGLLEESAITFTHMFGAVGKFDPNKHPRGRGGKFSEVLGKIAKLKEGQTHPMNNGVRVKQKASQYEVHHGARVVHKTSNVEDATRVAMAREQMPRPSAPAKPKEMQPGVGSAKDWITSKKTTDLPDEEKARVDAEVAQRTAEKGLTDEERSNLYTGRRKDLEQRASQAVASAAQAGKLTSAEAHFNDAGKVSQRTLANYVEEASTKPQTVDLYSKLDPTTGARVWDQSRRQLHERIITAYLKKRKVDPTTGKQVLDYSPDAADLQPSDSPSVLFSGGGYAAGKGGVLKILAARGELPQDSFTLDPDQIKAELPEFQAMIGTDPEANMHTYREAWAIAQEIQARAMEKKLNVVVDGISNTSPEEMGQRARAFTSRGYAARAVYVDIPTEEALKRAANRAINAKDDSDRRMIPEIIMRSVHRDVAATVPSLPGYLQEHNIPLRLEVWDNDQGKDEHGEFRPPKQFFHYENGVSTPTDQGLWDRFRNKGSETILHVDAPAGTQGAAQQ